MVLYVNYNSKLVLYLLGNLEVEYVGKFHFWCYLKTFFLSPEKLPKPSIFPSICEVYQNIVIMSSNVLPQFNISWDVGEELS